MTTKIRIFRVVFLNILRFRLHFISRLARESACFSATFLSLLFLMIFLDRQKKSRSFFYSRALRRTEYIDDGLRDSIP
jgi:hypothetical protein